MLETVEEKIERFRKYYTKMIDNAVAKSNIQYEGVPAKLLLCSIIDSLSIAAFPDEKNPKQNRIRFAQTIKRHSKWQDHDRVSMLQIWKAINSMCDVPQEFESFKLWLEKECNAKFYPSRSPFQNSYSLQNDPLYKEISQEWPKKEPKKLEKLNNKYLEQFTHRNLLWIYRNRLTHAFRPPGKGYQSPFKIEDDPYYKMVIDVKELIDQNGEKRWELVYPTGFFKNIANNCLESICCECLKKKRSPFLEYSEDSFWLIN
ncbi:hypothetical protein [Oligosphaera ethanolica]|uniref:Uncharacterized protein n=1 Tax=Oligosphaera ethanolica TaxID=760260 RepID=A0AAE3VCM2_9BACT|nr:hypothetical protein [Oligosphaera ethanolica]MDQ0288037.1 hypothetical protein [Oligosphaera ethanolica]